MKNGKASILSIIPKSKDNGSGKKTKTQYASAKNHIKIIASSAKELKNIGIAGNTDRQTQRIRDDIEAIIHNLQGLLSE